MKAKEGIYIKYDYFKHDDVTEILLEIEGVFSSYSWGAGFRVENFRSDEKYFYCELASEFYDLDDQTFNTTYSYVQGMISGYLIAKGVSII